MSRYLSERHKPLKAYVPGEQPGDMEYIKLNTNESPYPPPPGVIRAGAAEAERLNLYPNPDGKALKQKLAERYGMEPENVIIGNGSDELLAFAFLAFCDSSRGVCFPDITYGFYPVYAELYGITAKQIPLRADLTIDPSDYFDAGMNVVIANPNAPTGAALGLSEIEAIVRSNSGYVVLIDEAYVDFGAESAVGLTREYDNLLVVHTYSKSRSLAGARLAYAIGNRGLISDLDKMKYSFNPYNVNRMTQAMGTAALEEEEYYNEKQREIIATREYAAQKLSEMGFHMTSSQANFLFAVRPDTSGRELYEKLRARGILVRRFDKPRISEHLRISVGTRGQMDALINAVRDILDEGAVK